MAVIYRLDPFQNIINVHWKQPVSEPGPSEPIAGPWTASVLLRVPSSTRMMDGTLTGPFGGALSAIADDGVTFTGEVPGIGPEPDVHLWTYHIDDHPGTGDRFTIEVTVVMQLASDPSGNYFLAQLNADNFPTDSPHGGDITVDTVSRRITIDGSFIPGISVPPI